MIIRTDGSRLRLITQIDHARVAAQLARRWGGGLFECPNPPEPVRLAVTYHDEGWLEWDGAPRVHPTTGRPYDFLAMPVDEHLAIYERCIERTAAHHPYAGLLVSLHGSGLYRRRYGHMPTLQYKDVDAADQAAVDRFLARQQGFQEALLEQLRPDQAVLWTHYRWLQAWDALSVFLSLSLPGEERHFDVGPMPYCPGGSEVPMRVATGGDRQFVVTPWPFGVDQVEVSLPVRYVENRRYSSDQEFQAAYHAAPVEMVSWKGCSQ